MAFLKISYDDKNKILFLGLFVYFLYKNKKFDSSNNNKNIKNKILKFLINEVYKPLKLNYLKRFELNGFLFNTKYFINNNSLSNLFDNEYLVKFFSYKESKQIIPKKEFYFYHHMIFLERPNFKNLYFQTLKIYILIK